MYDGHSTLTAQATAESCLRALLVDAEQALQAAGTGQPTAAFECTVGAMILMSGLGFESGGLSIALPSPGACLDPRRGHGYAWPASGRGFAELEHRRQPGNAVRLADTMGGFTTQDMHRCRVTARVVALAYNWRSWYVRAANPQPRREALTNRPLRYWPRGGGGATTNGNQTTLYLTPMHAEVGLIKSMIANVHAAIEHVKAAAQQLPKIDRWRALLSYICQRIAGQIGLPIPPPTLATPG